MNISTTAASNAVASQKVAVPGTLQRAPESGATKDASAAKAGNENRSESSRDLQDTIELSAEAFRLAQTRKAEDRKSTDAAQKEAVDRIKAEVEADADAAEAVSGDERESTWQTQRNARLDRLQTMVRQGLYKVDPFMLDELAIRMVRMVR